MSPLPRILIAGRHAAGKDEMADWLAAHTPLRHPGSMSRYLLPHVVADRLGVSVEAAQARPDYPQLAGAAWASRHQDHADWYRVGHACRDVDLGVLVRPALAAGELIVGVRDLREFHYAERLVDLTVWVDRDVPDDPTLDFGPEACAVVLNNRGTLDEFHRRITQLVRFARLPLYASPVSE